MTQLHTINVAELDPLKGDEGLSKMLEHHIVFLARKALSYLDSIKLKPTHIRSQWAACQVGQDNAGGQGMEVIWHDRRMGAKQAWIKS